MTAACVRVCVALAVGGMALSQDSWAQAAAGNKAADNQADSTASGRRLPQRKAWYVYPVPTSEKLTGLKLTLIVARLWRTRLDGVTRPSTVFQHSAYTANHQVLVAFGGDLWAPGNDGNVHFEAAYSRFPAPFFGIGARTPASAQELFTPRTSALRITAQREVRPHTSVQVGLAVLHTSLVDLIPGGLLIGDSIAGSSGYTLVAPEVGVVIDSRDQTFKPRHGEFIQARIRVNVRPFGGSTGFQRWTLDARLYRPVGRGSVLALQGAFEGATGTVPFEELAQLGGRDLRAYVYGRWRDRQAARVQAEWRQDVVWRFGAVTFAGVGAIGPDLGALWRTPGRTTYGVGLRFNLSTKENANFSMDYAMGQDGASAVRFDFAEAF